MRFKAKPWELVFDLLSKWVVLGRDFKAKLEAQGKKIEAQAKKIEAQAKELESRLSALGTNLRGHEILRFRFDAKSGTDSPGQPDDYSAKSQVSSSRGKGRKAGRPRGRGSLLSSAGGADPSGLLG